MNNITLTGGENATQLIIAFDAVDRRERYLLNSVLRHSKAPVMHINTMGHELPNACLDTLFDRLPPTVAIIQEYINQYKPDKIGIIGVSLSAFPALHCGSLLRADVVVAMSTETLLGLPGSRSAPYLTGRTLRFAHPDIRRTFLASAPTSTHIYFGEEDATDIEAAWRLRDIPGVQLHSLKGVGHGVHSALARARFLRPLFENMLDPNFQFAEFSCRGSATDMPEAVETFLRGRVHYREKRYSEAVEDFAYACRCFPDNDTMLSALAMACFSKHDYQAAATHMHTVLERNPKSALVKYLDTAVSRAGRQIRLQERIAKQNAAERRLQERIARQNTAEKRLQERIAKQNAASIEREDQTHEQRSYHGSTAASVGA